MSALLDHALSFGYIGAALLIALISLFWGSQNKLTGASLLLASVLVSNIVYAARIERFLTTKNLVLSYVVLDLILAWIFLQIYRGAPRWDRCRWAAALAAVQLLMVSANFAGWASHGLIHSGVLGVALNILMVIAMAICLFNFIPKSMDEARSFLGSKASFLWHDLLNRTLGAILKVRSGVMFERRNGESANAIDSFVGGKIKQARIERQLTQAQLSNELGISQAQLQKYESGATRVSAAMLYFLSKLFGVKTEFFFEGFERREKIEAAFKAFKRN